MTTTETKITDDQLAAIQQIFPQGGVMLVSKGVGLHAVKGEVFRYDGHYARSASRAEYSSPTERFDEVTIHPLDPLKLKMDKWLATLPVRQYPGDVEERVAPNGITYKDETFMSIIQSWEKFKEVGE